MIDPGICVRHPDNPRITAASTGCSDVVKVYNPGGGRDFIVYRVVDPQNVSRLMQARSVDGGQTWIDHEPFPLQPDLSNPLEVMGYEDPRLVFVEDPDDPEFNQWVLTYAVYDGFNPRQHVATSRDRKTWTVRGCFPKFDIVKHHGWQILWSPDAPPRRSYVAPASGSHDRSKSGGALSQVLWLEVDGRLQKRIGFYFGEGGVWFAHCSVNFDDWRFTSHPVIPTPPRIVAIEAGAPPILRDYGWLGTFHYITEDSQYLVGMFVADRANPAHVKWYTMPDEAIMVPCEEYEIRHEAVDVIPGARALEAAGKLDELAELIKQAAENNAMPAVTFVSACWLGVDEYDQEVLHMLGGAQDAVIFKATAWMGDLEARMPLYVLAA